MEFKKIYTNMTWCKNSDGIEEWCCFTIPCTYQIVQEKNSNNDQFYRVIFSDEEKNSSYYVSDDFCSYFEYVHLAKSAAEKHWKNLLETTANKYLKDIQKLEQYLIEKTHRIYALTDGKTIPDSSFVKKKRSCSDCECDCFHMEDRGETCESFKPMYPGLWGE